MSFLDDSVVRDRYLTVTATLSEYGFQEELDTVIGDAQANIDSQSISWIGRILTLFGSVQVRFVIDDWQFLTLPDLYLIAPLPTQIKLPFPHLVLEPSLINGIAHYQLCYASADAQEPLLSNLPAYVRWILDVQTVQLLNDLVTNNQFLREELQREIEPMWCHLANYQSAATRIDKRFNHSFQQVMFKLDTHFSDLTERCEIRQVLHLMFINIDEKQEDKKLYSAILVRVGSALMPVLSWWRADRPPNLYDFMNWIMRWDIEAGKALLKKLKQQWARADKWETVDTHLLIPFCLLSSNGSVLPTVALINPNVLQSLQFLDQHHKISTSKLPKNKQQIISQNPHELYKQIPIQFIEPVNCAPQYIYSRNLEGIEQPNLAKLKIVLVGCGAVGGAIALALARLGAGSLGGQLVLIDSDTLQPHNLGRHVLGIKSLIKCKAPALKTMIQNQLPSLNVEAITKSVIKCGTSLNDAQLIIDATGMIEVSEWITTYRHKHSKDNSAPPSLLHIWVAGNGECVQGLLTEPDFACTRCLRDSGEVYFREPQYDPLPDVKTVSKFLACSSFTPYSVAASLNATGLAMDMVLDWVTGNSTPHYRTRYNERYIEQFPNNNRIGSTDIFPHPECPICSIT
ncbi:ThiF family adenylyltransferase [Acinetobacter sp. ANC 5383]